MSIILGEPLNVMTLTGESDQSKVVLLLEYASSAVRSYTRQTLSEETTTDVLRGTWGPVLELPQRPVSDVDSVSIDGVAVTGWEWDGLQGMRSSGWVAGESSGQGAGGCTPGNWGGPQTVVSVTYTHGWPFDELPGEITMITEGLAALALSTPAGVRTESIGSYSVTYSIESMGSVPRVAIHDAKVLDRYRRRWL